MSKVLRAGAEVGREASYANAECAVITAVAAKQVFRMEEVIFFIAILLSIINQDIVCMRATINCLMKQADTYRGGEDSMTRGKCKKLLWDYEYKLILLN